VQNALAHRGDGFGDVVGFEQLVALRVDHLALVVGDVVVFEQLLADVEVAGFDLALRRLQRTRHERMLDRLALGHFQSFHDRLQAITGKNAQQRVVEGEVETRRPGVALATRTAAQLVVDPPRLMPLGADDVQAAGRHHLVVQLLPLRPDVGDRASRRPRSAFRRRGACRDCFSILPPRTMSVPRPAMLVAMVIIPGRPASRTISASRACCLALST
jgi:hypothetical protein